MGTGVRTTLTVLVHSDTPSKIVGYAGIEAVIGTSEDIKYPHKNPKKIAPQALFYWLRGRESHPA